MSTMAFDTPKSSMTKRISYDADKHVLSVSFRTGQTEHLADVPVQHYQAMQTADSVGKYYHANLKGKFPKAK